MKLRGGAELVVNSDGIFVRRFVLDETLPYITTREVSVRSRVSSYLEAAGISLAKLLCMVVSSLREAAAEGSTYAEAKLRRCRELVYEITRFCADLEEAS
ncbi:MAG: hypothetical protein ABWW70_05325 [Thermoproteota archaeon]